jgi:membrane protease YdiL (CAAX protease family)
MIKKYIPILMGFSLLLSEIILKINTTFGFFCYAVLITGCLIALESQERLDVYSKLMIVLLILPMARIAELFIHFNYLWRSVIISFALLFFVLIYSIKLRIKPGFTKKKLGFLPLVLIGGVVLGVLGSGFVSEKYSNFIFILPLIVFAEELFFRGMMQNLTKESYGSKMSIILPSLVYAIFSLNFALPVIIIMFASSLICSIIYHYSKNIFLSVAFSLAVHLFIFALPIIK